MKSIVFLSFALVLLILAQNAPAATSQEQQWVAVLASQASPQEKDAACAQLKRIGTAESVPALARLLTDDQLSHSARYALESMAAPEAGHALIEALGRTRGLTKAGIAASLGIRRETAAVKALAGCLADLDGQVAPAAARALGQIGNEDSLKALQEAMNKATPAFVADGILAAAGSVLLHGKPAVAAKAYQSLYEASGADFVQEAAYRGMILSGGNKSLALFKQGLESGQGPAQNAALQLAHELLVPGATKTICEVLPGTQGPNQAALVEALGQRSDPSAVPTLVRCATSGAPETRLAAIKSLGAVGSGAAVSTLAGIAASSSGAEQSAAREALLQVHGPEVGAQLARELKVAPPAIQAELARALGQRGGAAALPELLRLVKDSRGGTRTAALQALSALAGEEQIPILAGFVTSSPDEQSRSQAAETLNAVVQRVLSSKGKLDPNPLLKELDSAPVESQLALLPVLSGIAEPKVRDAFRARMAQANPQVREAAIRALCDTVDPALVPDLLKIATESTAENLRMLAVRACVRLVTENAAPPTPAAQQLEVLKQLMGPDRSAEQKRIVLAGLGEVPDVGALQLVRPCISDAALANEAARAAIKLVAVLPDTEAAFTVLEQIGNSAAELGTREAAKAAQNTLELRKDYVTSWQAAGPFSQQGKGFAALFDTEFAPENKTEKNPDWRPLPASADPQRPWSMDLLKQFGREQCVAYARTGVYSETEQPALLEIGSDDGVKVWLNGTLVHANNTARPLTPDSDKANVKLKQGWNELLLKVTQNNLGWEFSVRFKKPDGSRLPGLKWDAAHP
jgi:HEAT repeat protein